jgi:O-antigen ligase
VLIVAIFLSIKLYHFKKDSADGRLLMWTVSLNMIKEKPLTGFVPGGFRKLYPLWQGEYIANRDDSLWTILADDVSSPFNEFLKTGIEQGIIGLLFIAGIICFRK